MAMDLMIAAPHPSLWAGLGMGALLLWRVYARIRRNIGRQTFSRRRALTTLILFPLLLVLISAGALAHPQNLLALAAGAGLGVALGILGLRLTRFEPTAQGFFYTPSAHLGIALSLLFIGRMAYRLVQLYSSGMPMAPNSQFVSSPLTLAIFGMLAAYYISYAFGLLRQARHTV